MLNDTNPEILTAAELTVRAAKKELNKTLDYSTNSVNNLEALIQHVKSHLSNLKKDGKLTDQTIQRASVSIGAYLGEVIRRHHGGNWIAKNAIMKTLVINSQEFSPILYIFQRLTKDSDYSPENYWSDVRQKLHPSEKFEDKLHVSETPEKLVNTVTGIGRLRVVIAVISLLFILGSVFGWYYLYGPCGTQLVKKASLELFDNTERFNDAYKVAASTSRIALSGPIGDLQEIQRDAKLIEVPACLANSKNWLVAGMQNYTDGFIAFMGEADDTEVDLYFATGDLYISATTNEMNFITECAPFCKTESNKPLP